MRERTGFSTKTKSVVLVTLLAFLFLAATWLHMYRRPSDFKIETALINSLNSGSGRLSEIFADAETVCFMQSYAIPNGSLPISERERNLLDLSINHLIGSGDHVWWIVSIKNRSVNSLHRMSGKVRPRIQGIVCASTTNGVISKDSSSNKYTIYFIGNYLPSKL